AAAEAFRRGLAAGPDYRFSTDYARYLLDAEDFDGAQAQWAQMQKLGPGRLDTLLVAADIARRRGQFDAARQAYATAARAYPFRSEPLVGLADMA
ncbi:tetratricopeptide repeat protein, partial [Klebsiella pneumoniae]|uniref:tetratricopeptide repeat protein n=1 Tax=Klebsiella pneumoniae TaxID=573 RepID=UPI0038523C42